MFDNLFNIIGINHLDKIFITVSFSKETEALHPAEKLDSELRVFRLNILKRNL